MGGEIKKEGKYEIFRSTGGEQILSLDGEQFVLTEGPKGEDMLLRQDGYEKEQVLVLGEYQFEERGEEARLRLERDGHFQVVRIRGGLPSKHGAPHECIRCEDLDEEEQKEGEIGRAGHFQG